MTGGTRSDVRIELYVRSVRPSGKSDLARAMDRLDALVAGDVVESYRVVVWGDRAPPSPEETRTAAGRFVLDRVTTFRRWARHNDATVAAPFTVRDVDSEFTGESHSELVLPRLVLAAYRDGDLANVLPHERDGTTTSVREYLTRLAEGDLPETTTIERGPAAVTVPGGPPSSRGGSAPGDTGANPVADAASRPESNAEPDAHPTTEAEDEPDSSSADRPFHRPEEPDP